LHLQPSSVSIDKILLIVIAQLVVIIAAARASGTWLRRLGQPMVCGEIAAGLLLGPSLLGRISPGIESRLFDASAAPTFAIMSQLGLLLLMFLIGLEFDFGHLARNRRAAVSISAAGAALPFALGMALGQFMHPALGLSGSRIEFSLFMATAMSITAVPVLGRIMIELNIHRTRIGTLTISAAAVNDVAGWILLALVTSVVRSTFSLAKAALIVCEVIGYATVMLAVVRPLASKWALAQVRKSRGELSLNALAALLIMVLLSAAVTNLIGVSSLFGGLIMGALLFDQKEVGMAIRARLHDFVAVFFLPIFFTYTGLRTDIGSMQGWGPWAFCVLVLLAASIGKFGGCAAAARAHRIPWRESAAIGVMMNTRGLMELVVVNIGYDLGIIPRPVFFMLVLMAVTTTYITTPLLLRVLRGSETGSAYLRSSADLDRLSSAVASEQNRASVEDVCTGNEEPATGYPGER
jgi:Kef-type K+ transport system membrane component KefB